MDCIARFEEASSVLLSAPPAHKLMNLPHRLVTKSLGLTFPTDTRLSTSFEQDRARLCQLCARNLLQFLTEDRHQRVAFLSRETYEIDGGGFSTVAGVVLLALLSSSLWFSWMWPGEQILSSGTVLCMSDSDTTI